MDKQELIDCMREASQALAELARATPDEADEQILKARRHVDRAIAILECRRSRGFMRLVE